MKTQNKSFPCDVCWAEFFKVGRLNENVISHAGKACQYCGKMYSCYSSLKFHVDSKHSLKSFECPSCGENFSGMGVLRRHKKTNACQTQQNREKNIYCGLCGKGYKTKKSLNKHFKKHLVEKPVDSEPENLHDTFENDHDFKLEGLALDRNSPIHI